MDINLASKLVAFPPEDVQRVTYVVDYAQHNFTGDAINGYIKEHLESDRLIGIADVILENRNMATIKAKPSDASGKIDTVKEKGSTEGPVTATQKSVSAKGTR